MSYPNLHFARTAVDLKDAPIRPEWILGGAPIARNSVLSSSADRLATTLVWDCTPGRFKWIYDTDETIYILEGKITLTTVDGATRALAAGDVVFFPAGSSAVWEVLEHVRKLAFFRQPVPHPLALILRALRKVFSSVPVTGAGMTIGATESPYPESRKGRLQLASERGLSVEAAS
jgi:uncharacterized protein